MSKLWYFHPDVALKIVFKPGFRILIREMKFSYRYLACIRVTNYGKHYHGSDGFKIGFKIGFGMAGCERRVSVGGRLLLAGIPSSLSERHGPTQYDVCVWVWPCSVACALPV